MKKKRRDSNASTSVDSKLRTQSYFKGVFPEARNLTDPDEDQLSDDEEMSNTDFDF